MLSQDFAMACADAETAQQAAFARVVGIPIDAVESAGPAVDGVCVLRAELNHDQKAAAERAGYRWSWWRMRNAGVCGKFSAQGWH